MTPGSEGPRSPGPRKGPGGRFNHKQPLAHSCRWDQLSPPRGERDAQRCVLSRNLVGLEDEFFNLKHRHGSSSQSRPDSRTAASSPGLGHGGASCSRGGGGGLRRPAEPSATSAHRPASALPGVRDVEGLAPGHTAEETGGQVCPRKTCPHALPFLWPQNRGPGDHKLFLPCPLSMKATRAGLGALLVS